jgi:glutamate-1-semialdehyde 2,1-aminomutase
LAKNEHFEKTISTYEKNTPKSKELYEKSVQILPGGIGGSAASYEPYHLLVEKGEGAKIWDVDGNEYLDFNLCWGALMVGHRHPAIIKGLQEKLEAGTMFGLHHEESIDAAEALIDRFPIDKLRFVNSGSEATLYAIRLARRYTGKDKIMKVEGSYHGVMDSLHISKKLPMGKAGPTSHPTPIPYGKGIPQSTVDNTIITPFNDLDTTRALIEENIGEIAAIIVEPTMMNVGVIPPEEGYLDELRELTEDYNIVLIFDEVKTGVKIAKGGACEYFGIEPDIVSLAKAIGGGLPLGAVGGKAEILDGIGDEGLFGTFSANPLSIRACHLALTEVLTDEKYKELEELGNALMDGYRDIIEDEGLEAVIQGINAVGGIFFTKDHFHNYREWTRIDGSKNDEYWLAMVNEGIIPMAYGADEEWLISAQHTMEDINTHLEAFKTIAPEL